MKTLSRALARYVTPLACGLGFLAVTLLAACGGGDQGRDPILGLPAATLVGVSVTPATASVAAGNSQQFVATASYTDGSTRDVSTAASWTSATPTVASVNAASGMATGVIAGNAAISAAFSGKSGSASLTVLPPVLVSLVLTPATASVAVGASQRYTAVGTYSDRSTRDVTTLTTFTSETASVASIAAGTNLATGNSAGQSRIVASSAGLTANATLTVTGATLVSLALSPQNPTLQVGATAQLAATATYSDGSTTDVTSQAQFSSAAAGVASVSAAALTTGVTNGAALISASYGGLNATTSVTVSTVTLSSISVTPASASIAVGATRQFVATATYSDNSTAIITNTALWSSSATAAATIASSGLASGVAPGVSTISATSAGKSGNAQLTVTAVVPVTPPAGNPPAASVNLRSAANFAVLAGTSITNNSGGTTLITGDVGSPSQTTDPVQVAGYTNYKSGAILASALGDLQTAITDANGRSCDVNFAGDIDLGGKTLGPGVYCYAGAISITGTLTLSGPGVYIFRTALTLNSTANSIVALGGGASASDVNWLPVGPTTLGANSVFKGNILGQSAAITVGDNTTLLNGRALSAAAVTLRNNQIAK